MRQVVIRADAYEETGSGHIVRCLTLAKRLMNDDVSVAFICRSISENLHQEAVQDGCNVVMLSDTRYTESFAVSQIKDAEDTLEVLDKIGHVQCLIVDSYNLSAEWEQIVYPAVDKLFVLDDYPQRKHYCDILLNPDYPPSLEKEYRTRYLLRDTKLYLGPRYYFFRKEFFEIVPRDRREFVFSKVLVTFGGSDNAQATELIINVLKSLPDLDITVYVVVGGGNPRWASIKALCDTDGRFRCLRNINYMAKLMNEVDMVIGSAGITAWECCFLKVPLLAISVAENQVKWINTIRDNDLFLYLGGISDVKNSDISKMIVQIKNGEIKPNDCEAAHKRYFPSRDRTDMIVNEILS